VVILRQFVAFLLIGALAGPAWGGSSSVVGVALNSQGAAVGAQNLSAGSTVFSGDGVAVDKNGNATIALTGGGQIQVLEESVAVLTRSQSSVQFAVQQGTVSFRSAPNAAVEAVMSDATIRAAKGGSAVGMFGMESPTSAIVVAEKNALEITTAHDSRTWVVPEGSAARLTLVNEPEAGQVGQAPPAAGKSASLGLSKRTFIIVAIIIGGGALLAALLLAHHERKIAASTLLNEISPFTLQ